MDYKNFKLDFIRRTLQILESYDSAYDVTLLINCCIGLVVVPKEIHWSVIPDTPVSAGSSYWGIDYHNITSSVYDEEYKLKDVVRRIRNGICHAKITPLSDAQGEVDRIVIEDYGFTIQFSIDQFSEFAKSLAMHVLE